MASAPQSGTIPGNQQSPQAKGTLKCGEVGTYGDLSKKTNPKKNPRKKKSKPTFNNDHVPAKAQLLKRAAKLGAFKVGKSKAVQAFNACVRNGVINGGMAIAIPVEVHYKGATYGGKNNSKKITSDSRGPVSLENAKTRDLDAIEKHLSEPCKTQYKAARKEVEDFDVDKMIADVKKKCENA
jgi:hypothetical protein